MPTPAETAWNAIRSGLSARTVAVRMGVRMPEVFRLLDQFAPVAEFREAALAKLAGEGRGLPAGYDHRADELPVPRRRLVPSAGPVACGNAVGRSAPEPVEPRPSAPVTVKHPVRGRGGRVRSFDHAAAFDRAATGEWSSWKAMAAALRVTQQSVHEAMKREAARRGVPPMRMADVRRATTSVTPRPVTAVPDSLRAFGLSFCYRLTG